MTNKKLDDQFVKFRLPNGTIVKIYRSVARRHTTIDYTLANGVIVQAVRVTPLEARPPRKARSTTRTAEPGSVEWAEARGGLIGGYEED